MAPRIIAQGIRFPQNTVLDVGPTAGNGYQLRAALTVSPLDVYKGFNVMRVAEADCSQHEAAVVVQDVLTRAMDGARSAALRAQADYLRAHRDEWQALEAKASERLSGRVITVVEFNALRQAVDTLDQKLVEVEGEAAQLEAHAPPLPGDESLGDKAQRYFEESMRFERETTRIRNLDPWHFQVTGGVIPVEPVDWYGVAEVSFSLAGLVRPGQEREYLAARADELTHARYEVLEQVKDLRAQAAAALTQARRDLELIEHDVAVIASTQSVLENSDAENIAHAKDTLAIEQLSNESVRVFLNKWIGALTSVLKDRHGQ
jgi:hypothetical protein